MFHELSKQIRSGVLSYFAIIYNLGYAAEGGTHWVPLFVDLREKTIEYCDSVANKPPYLINREIERLSREHNLRAKINKQQYQRKNTECGVFSLHYILMRLKSIHDLNNHVAKTFEDYIRNHPDDVKVYKCRKVYFREERKK